MIQKLNPILEEAERKGRAVGAFTATSFEALMAILDVAEKRNEPVIIKHIATYEKEIPIKYMGPTIIELAKKSKVDICPMLDHCKNFDYIKEGLKMGFTAVMYDGANLSYEENVKLGKQVVSYAKSADANIEASFGVVGGLDGEKSTITNIDELMRFINEVDIDALAPSVGNTHDVCEKSSLDFDLLKEISEKTKLPLVLHGAANLSEDDLRKAIKCGVRKMNYLSMAGNKETKEYLNSTSNPSIVQMTNVIVNAKKADIDYAMNIFAMK